uniref:Putative secreted protein n=1 Tax=Anopheles triannulatus TaxID=58253 RepID=A0A2M4B305_9DIPT
MAPLIFPPSSTSCVCCFFVIRLAPSLLFLLHQRACLPHAHSLTFHHEIHHLSHLSFPHSFVPFFPPTPPPFLRSTKPN